jgi:hypothetical protein
VVSETRQAELRRLIQEQLNDMSDDERRSIGPEYRRTVARLGLRVPRRSTHGGRPLTSDSPITDDIDAAVNSAKLGRMERACFRALLSGKSLRTAGKQLGISHETTRTRGREALAKLRLLDPDRWGRFRTVADVLDDSCQQSARRMVERARRESRTERVRVNLAVMIY